MGKNIIAAAMCMGSLSVSYPSRVVAATYYADYQDGSNDNSGATAS